MNPICQPPIKPIRCPKVQVDKRFAATAKETVMVLNEGCANG